MTKISFILALKDKLCGLPQSDVEERLGFYCEMIEDRIEDGLSEEDAVSAIGSVDEIAAQILSDIPLSKIVKEKIKPKKKLSPWEIILICLGSPIWFSLLCAAFAVVFSCYVSLWAVLISLWAVFAALCASALGCLVGGVIIAIYNNVHIGIICIAASLICGGLSILTFIGCKQASKVAIFLTKKMGLFIKKCFIEKEEA